MKKTGFLLVGMLMVTGALAYAWHQLPHEESDLYRQTDLGAEQTELEEQEQVIRQERAQIEISLDNCYAYQQLPEGEQIAYLEILDALVNFRQEVSCPFLIKKKLLMCFNVC